MQTNACDALKVPAGGGANAYFDESLDNQS